MDAGPEDPTPDSRPGLPPEDRLSEGDHLFCVSLPVEAEFVWAMQTTSQWLTEAHQWNLEKIGEIPDYL